MIRSLRIYQWIKNLFIFSPLIFGQNFFNFEKFQATSWVFLGFCALSSCIYIINDFIDKERDAQSPYKNNIFVQRGVVKARPVLFLSGFLFLLGCILCAKVNQSAFWIGIGYIILNVIYSLYAKQFIIIDVFFISLGFQARLWAGGVASGIFPSFWLQACIFCLSLFLGFAKRRREIYLLKGLAIHYRENLLNYSVRLLDILLFGCAGLTALFYTAYVFLSFSARKISPFCIRLSVVLVVVGIIRYLCLVYSDKKRSDPSELILSDIFVLSVIIIWVAYIFILLYR
ncbi:MAG: UbiA prenyltransferase family protein [Candidatus Aceula meridiana]|nr:UbiA prenyltransferase family protein [Candidatus Aceula meridiana]